MSTYRRWDVVVAGVQRRASIPSGARRRHGCSVSGMRHGVRENCAPPLAMSGRG